MRLVFQIQNTPYETSLQGQRQTSQKRLRACSPKDWEIPELRLSKPVHDEIILEFPEWMAGEVAVVLKQNMTQAGKAYLSRVPVEVEVTIGGTWAEK